MIEELYKRISNDQAIIDIYDAIGKREDDTNDWAYHNNDHVKNVTTIVENILSSLNYDKEFIAKAKIACLLHDVGALEGKDGHQERSYLFAQKYFKENNIEFDGMEDVLDAIKNHSAGFDSDNIITLSLILSDKLDIKKSRIAKEGLNVPGNRQYSHIDDIKIDIQNNTFTVNFVTDGNMDVKEANEYYFTKKVFKAVMFFSKKLGLDYKIIRDEKEWVLDLED
jgi:hypothetical protein